jgi:hypothetical protein
MRRLGSPYGVREVAHEGRSSVHRRRVAQPRIADKKTNAKQRVWEVRVSSILKLDRAEKVGPEEQDSEDINPEEEAA